VTANRLNSGYSLLPRSFSEVLERFFLEINAIGLRIRAYSGTTLGGAPLENA